MINPGKGLPLFPSEQFWSLQVMYCDPVGRREMRGAKNTTKGKNKAALLLRNQGFALLMRAVLAQPERQKFWRPILIRTNR